LGPFLFFPNFFFILPLFVDEEDSDSEELEFLRFRKPFLSKLKEGPPLWPLWPPLPPRKENELNFPRLDAGEPMEACGLMSALRVFGTASLSQSLFHKVPLFAANVILPLRITSTISLSTSV
jgi:hypothetical protein